MPTKARSRIAIILISGLTTIALATVASLWIVGNIGKRSDSLNFDLTGSMTSAGYTLAEDSDFAFEKEVSGIVVRVEFDFEAFTAHKNGYSFDLTNQYFEQNNKHLVSGEKLSEILNYEFSGDRNRPSATPITQAFSETFLAPELVIIGHAGGAVREAGDNYTYTNSLEAIQQNYALGIRAFELDFYLTSDNKLAAIHDWRPQYGREDGLPMSESEWQSFKPRGKFTSMMIDDVLEQMLINRDMYLITDTKSFELPTESTDLAFQEILDRATQLDPSLLDRIIPQVYNQHMYAQVKNVYVFPHIIYTLYASPDTNEEALAFIQNNADIDIVTVWDGTFRTEDQAFLNGVSEVGRRVYTHPVNSYQDIAPLKAKGISGIYSAFLTQADVDTYNQTLN